MFVRGTFVPPLSNLNFVKMIPPVVMALMSQVPSMVKNAVDYKQNQQQSQANSSLMSSIASAAIPAVANIAATAITNGSNYRHFLENRSYNEPTNEMSRMIEAGINPQAAAQGISKSPASSEPFVAQSPDLSSLSDALLQNDAYVQEKRLMNARIRNLDADSTSKDIENWYKPRLLSVAYDNLVKDGLIKNEEIKTMIENNRLLPIMNDVKLEQMQGQRDQIFAQLDLIELQYEYEMQEIKKIKAETRNINQDTANKKLEGELIKSETYTEQQQGAIAYSENRVAERTVDARVMEANANAKKAAATANALEELGFEPKDFPALYAYYQQYKKGGYSSADDFLRDLNLVSYKMSEYEYDIQLRTPTGNPFQSISNSIYRGKRKRYGHRNTYVRRTPLSFD